MMLIVGLLERDDIFCRHRGAFTQVQNLYPNATPTPSLAVQLLGSAPSDQPKQ